MNSLKKVIPTTTNNIPSSVIKTISEKVLDHFTASTVMSAMLYKNLIEDYVDSLKYNKMRNND